MVERRNYLCYKYPLNHQQVLVQVDNKAVIAKYWFNIPYHNWSMQNSCNIIDSSSNALPISTLRRFETGLHPQLIQS